MNYAFGDGCFKFLFSHFEISESRVFTKLKIQKAKYLKIQKASNNKNVTLFEYQNKVFYGNDAATGELEHLLNTIWAKRRWSPMRWLERYGLVASSTPTQAFLTIDRKNHVQARNYVGIIKHQDKVIQLLPKVFFQKNKRYTSQRDIQNIYAHIMWWLTYCQHIPLPFAEANFDELLKGDMAEVLIYMFANYTHELLLQRAYTTYQTQLQTLPYVKGRLQVQSYLTQQLSRGNWQQLPCRYEAFDLDNPLNQLLKCVCRMLLPLTQRIESQQLLQNIVDELSFVQEKNLTIEDAKLIQLNPLFEEWQLVLNYCRLFLAQSTVLTGRTSLPLLAFLVPMEQLFEQFVFGFLQKHFPQYEAKFQDSSTYLARNERGKKVFQLKNDILLTDSDGTLKIIDCKYKLIDIDVDNQSVSGMEQRDLYQIATYAVRRGCQEVYLLYPNTIEDSQCSTNCLPKVYFEIVEQFSGQNIRLCVAKISFVGWAFHHSDIWRQSLLEDLKKLF